MDFFTRTKPTDPPKAAAPAGKKIVLNFGGRAAQVVAALATATLEAGGFDAAAPAPTVGQKMPDGTVYAGVSPASGKPMY